MAGTSVSPIFAKFENSFEIQESANGTYWSGCGSSSCLASLGYVVSQMLSAATDARYNRITRDSADRMSTTASSSIRG